MDERMDGIKDCASERSKEMDVDRGADERCLEREGKRGRERERDRERERESG